MPSAAQRHRRHTGKTGVCFLDPDPSETPGLHQTALIATMINLRHSTAKVLRPYGKNLPRRRTSTSITGDAHRLDQT